MSGLRPEQLTEDVIIYVTALRPRPLEPEILAQQSAVVIEATVRQIGLPQWNTPNGRPPSTLDPTKGPYQEAIYTPIIFDVTQTLKGDPHPSLQQRPTYTYYHLGGTVGRLTMKVPDSHEFAPGETLLLFLSNYGQQMGVPGGLFLTDAYLYESTGQATSLSSLNEVYPVVKTVNGAKEVKIGGEDGS